MIVRPRISIILFLIGAIILYLGVGLFHAGPTTFIGEFYQYCIYVAIGGLLLQVLAIMFLWRCSKLFHYSLFFVLVDAILIAAYLILPVVLKDADLSKPLEILSLAMMVAEALIMIFFVLGVNQLAYDNFGGMPFLTKLIIFAYIFITAVQLIAGVLVLFNVTLNGVPYAETIVTVIDKIADGLTLAKEVGTVVFFIIAIVVIKD